MSEIDDWTPGPEEAPQTWDLDPLENSGWSVSAGNGEDCDTIYFDFDAETDPEQVALIATVDCGAYKFVENLNPVQVVPRAEAVETARELVQLARDWFENNEHKRPVGWRRAANFVKCVEVAVHPEKWTVNEEVTE